jgi:hypothetical protein
MKAGWPELQPIPSARTGKVGAWSVAWVDGC